MSVPSYFLPRQMRQILQKYIEAEAETCINLTLSPGSSSSLFNLTINRETISPGVNFEYAPGKVRGACRFITKNGENDPFIFHSHPMHLRSYPSPEDLIKVLSHREIRASLIGTRWGLWIIRPGTRANDYEKLRPDDSRGFQSCLTHNLDLLDKIEGKRHSILDDEEMFSIRQIMAAIYACSGLDIVLIRWGDWQGDLRLF